MFLGREVKIFPESLVHLKGKEGNVLFILKISLGSCLLSGEQRMATVQSQIHNFIMKTYRDGVFGGYWWG